MFINFLEQLQLVICYVNFFVAGNIPAPMFSRKRPRQAIFAHPKNSQTNGTVTAGTSFTQSTGNLAHGRGGYKGQTGIKYMYCLKLIFSVSNQAKG